MYIAERLAMRCRYTDMESEDYAFYQGLVFLLDNNIGEIGYELTFSTEVSQKTVYQCI